MQVDFANLSLAYKEHKVKIDSAIEGVIESSSFIMGKEVAHLEEKLSKFTGAKHVITCSNGTDALLLAMMALNIQPGDEIITTPFTFISTAETIAFLGAVPVFVDIDEKSFNIDASLIENKINSRTKAIMPVSLFGQMADMSSINIIANKYKLHVIEDGAQSFGATMKGIKSCNSSTIGTTSFFPAKPLGCFGDGGAVFTNDDNLAEKIFSLRIHGQEKKYYHKYIGMGGRLDTLQAAVLSVKIDYYNNDILRRQKVAKTYSSILEPYNNISLPYVNNGFTSVWAQYSIRLKERSRVQDTLKEMGIPTAIYYPKPLHLQECFKYLKYTEGDFKNSEKASREVLSLPMNPYLTEKELVYITNVLTETI